MSFSINKLEEFNTAETQVYSPLQIGSPDTLANENDRYEAGYSDGWSDCVRHAKLESEYRFSALNQVLSKLKSNQENFARLQYERVNKIFMDYLSSLSPHIVSARTAAAISHHLRSISESETAKEIEILLPKDADSQFGDFLLGCEGASIRYSTVSDDTDEVVFLTLQDAEWSFPMESMTREINEMLVEDAKNWNCVDGKP